MALDLTLLRIMRKRKQYDRLAKAVPERAIDSVTKTLLKDFGQWFKQHPDAAVIDMESFKLWVKLAHPKLADEKLALLQSQLRKADQDVDPDVEAGIVEQLATADTAVVLADLLEKWTAGEEVDLFQALHSETERLKVNLERKIKSSVVDTDIDDQLDEEENDSGLHWRLPCLNESMRPLRGGDFGIVAARVDAGKTSFITDNVTFMAPQLPEGQRVVWLCNEGPGKRIMARCYQSALNMTMEEMQALRHAGRLKSAYATAVGGISRIVVHNIHDMAMHDVEAILDKERLGLVIVDMADNIRYEGDISNGGQRTDQFLESMYQRWRNLSVKYDVPILATSQVSGDGEGLCYPTQTMLKDSKTGKQGAAEFIVTIGKSNDPMLEASRFIGLTKNKLNRPGKPRDPRMEVLFDGARGRFNEPE